MITKRIVYTRSDGGISIVAPSPNSRQFIRRPDGPPWLEPEDAWLRRIAHQSVPAGATNVGIIDTKSQPKDRTYREAWVNDGGRIGVHMDRAREIHRERLRKARAPELAKLDVEYQRADEAGNDAGKKQIAARKQELRDITAHPDIDAAPTPDELARVWPFGNPHASTPLPTPPQQPPPPSNLWKIPDLLAKASEEQPTVAPLPPEPESTPSPHVEPQPLMPAVVEQAVDDAMRRRLAKARISSAVEAYGQATNALHPRYELAMLAHNRNVSAMADMEQEANLKGTSVAVLSEFIINDYRTRQRRLMQFWAIKARCTQEIDAATGDDILKIEAAALAAINGAEA